MVQFPYKIACMFITNVSTIDPDNYTQLQFIISPLVQVRGWLIIIQFTYQGNQWTSVTSKALHYDGKYLFIQLCSYSYTTTYKMCIYLLGICNVLYLLYALCYVPIVKQPNYIKCCLGQDMKTSYKMHAGAYFHKSKDLY